MSFDDYFGFLCLPVLLRGQQRAGGGDGSAGSGAAGCGGESGYCAHESGWTPVPGSDGCGGGGSHSRLPESRHGASHRGGPAGTPHGAGIYGQRRAHRILRGSDRQRGEAFSAPERAGGGRSHRPGYADGHSLPGCKILCGVQGGQGRRYPADPGASVRAGLPGQRGPGDGLFRRLHRAGCAEAAADERPEGGRKSGAADHESALQR